MKSSFTIAGKIAICATLAFAVAILSACSASRKLQTANILKKCDFSFQRAQLDAFTGDSLKFSIFLNANNKGADSLFIKNLTGTARLDSLFEIPVSLAKPLWISSGNNTLQFQGALQLDLFKLLALPTVEKFNIKGTAAVALEPEQESVDIDFNESRDIPPDLAGRIIRRLVSGGH